MFDGLREELTAAKMRDPAARSSLEILCCYPGIWAILFHRVNHWLWTHHLPFWGRFFSQISRFLTGIEIHPGAQIGKRVFIDHGMGIVIGETAIVGNDVLIYQQVTLGGTGSEQGKRHPTIGNNVIIGAGAKILGNITIGDNVRIGAGSVVVDNVPDGSTVVGVPGRVVQQKILNHDGVLMHNRIPDPVKCELNRLKYEVQELKEQITKE